VRRGDRWGTFTLHLLFNSAVNLNPPLRRLLKIESEIKYSLLKARQLAQ
jgi:hypothetical protein